MTDMTLPFLKWPGGKRWVASTIAAIIRERESLKGIYYEPFLGGGAVFFTLRPHRAVLSDINTELINVYAMVQNQPDAVLHEIQALPVTQEDYYRIRAWEPEDPVLRAARFLYLNRTAFGGIYRLNRQGQFNVPYGGGERTPGVLWGNDLLKKASKALAGVEIRHNDFGPILRSAREGDVIYCDPTYTVAHDTNGFVRYNERNFSWADQERLATAAHMAVERGALVIVSTAHHPTVKALYPKAEVRVLERRSLVSAKSDRRRMVYEYLFILCSYSQ